MTLIVVIMYEYKVVKQNALLRYTMAFNRTVFIMLFEVEYLVHFFLQCSVSICMGTELHVSTADNTFCNFAFTFV